MSYQRTMRRRAERAADEREEVDAMDQQQDGGDDLLTDMTEIMGEVATHTARLQRAAKTAPAPVRALATEVAETLLPLLRDGLQAAYNGYAELRQYLDEEVDPYLDEAAAAAGDGESVLSHEDAEMLRGLLGYLREVLVTSQAQAPEEGKEPLADMIGKTEAALARISEIEVEDDGEETEPPGANGAEPEPEAEGTSET